MSTPPEVPHALPPYLGPYRVLGQLGEGSTGVVYASVDTLDRRVAVKAVRAELAADPAFRAAFAREVAAVRAVMVPTLVPMLAADVTSETLWQAAPQLDGPNLQAAVTGSGPLTGEALRGCALNLAGALATLHTAGVVHQQLRPSKVLLTPSGTQLLNYRAAQALTATGTVPGPHDWFAPEQHAGSIGDAASDVFAWGLLVAFAATGRHPFGNGDPARLADRVSSGAPDLTGVPAALLPHVAAALTNDPLGRPQAGALAANLAATPTGPAEPVAPVPVRPPNAPPQFAPSQFDKPPHGQSPHGQSPHGQAAPGFVPYAPPQYPAPAKSSRTPVLIAVAMAAVFILGIIGVGAVLYASSGSERVAQGSSTFPPDPTASPSSEVTPESAPPSTAPAPKAPGKQWSSEPAMTIDTAAGYTATLGLGQGELRIQLFAAKAPHTVNSFAFLAGQGYFTGTSCHRLTSSGIFVLQCGDPTGTGTGGPGYTFKDENLDAFGTGASVVYPAGTLAMANAGPGTNGSQFFLVYKDSPLPPAYTPFGRITGGLDVLQAIAAKGTADGSGDGRPKEPVVLQKVTVSKG